MTETAKQYALALFSLASKDGESDEIYQEFHPFIDAFDDLAWKFFLNPKIDHQAKHQVIESLINHQLLINFLKTVIDNHRFNFIEDILKAYKDLLNESHQVAELTVYSKVALTKTEQKKLIDKFSKVLNKKIIINEVIRPSIVGGIRIEYQGKVLDQTINASLKDIKASLIG